MYQSHPSFETPENKDGKIWRFMDFTKFVDILANNSLYFCRCDLLGDPFEGQYTSANLESYLKNARNDRERKLARNFFWYKS